MAIVVLKSDLNRHRPGTSFMYPGRQGSLRHQREVHTDVVQGDFTGNADVRSDAAGHESDTVAGLNGTTIPLNSITYIRRDDTTGWRVRRFMRGPYDDWPYCGGIHVRETTGYIESRIWTSAPLVIGGEWYFHGDSPTYSSSSGGVVYWNQWIKLRFPVRHLQVRLPMTSVYPDYDSITGRINDADFILKGKTYKAYTCRFDGCDVEEIDTPQGERFIPYLRMTYRRDRWYSGYTTTISLTAQPDPVTLLPDWTETITWYYVLDYPLGTFPSMSCPASSSSSGA